MTEIYVTPQDGLTALAAEAKKRKISYGQLVSTTTSYEQQQIVRQYCAERGKKSSPPPAKTKKTRKRS